MNDLIARLRNSRDSFSGSSLGPVFIWSFWLLLALGHSFEGFAFSETVPEASNGTDLMQRIERLDEDGEYDLALDLALHYLTLLEAQEPPAQAQQAFCMAFIGKIFFHKGWYDEALQWLQYALTEFELVGVSSLVETAETVNLLGLIYKQKGFSTKAAECYNRALELRRQLGQESTEGAAVVLSNLAVVYQETGLIEKAEATYLAALELLECTVGPDAELTSHTLNNLGSLFMNIGAFDKAEPLFLRALQIKSHFRGPDHPQLAQFLNNLAVLYHNQKLYDKANAYFHRSLAIREKTLGTEHVAVARALGNLARYAWERGAYDEAVSLNERALAIYVKQLGPDNATTLKIMTRLARLSHVQGRYEEAERRYQEVVVLLDKRGSPEPMVAAELDYGLGLLSMDQGKFSASEKYFLRVKDHYRELYRANQSKQELVLTALCKLYGRMGRTDDCQTVAVELMAALDSQLLLNFHTFHEGERLQWLQATARSFDYFFSALKLDSSASHHQLTAGWDHCLFRKSLTQQLLAGQKTVVETTRDPRLRELLRQLTELRLYSARLFHDRSSAMTDRERQQELTDLQASICKLDKQLAEACTPYNLEQRLLQVTSKHVANLLPRSAVLVDYYRYQEFDFTKGKIMAPRYGAFVVKGGTESAPRWIDLGSAQTMEAGIALLRGELLKPARGLSRAELEASSTEVESLCLTLSQKLLAPLTPYLQGIDRLIVSPDAELHALPFELLYATNGDPLESSCLVQYLSSAKDLVKYQASSAAEGAACIFAAPDFDAQAVSGEPELLLKQDTQQPTWLETSAQAIGRLLTLRDGASFLRDRLRFTHLPETVTEALQIDKLLKGRGGRESRLFLGAEASEQHFKALVKPAIVHVASHSFFLSGCEAHHNAVASNLNPNVTECFAGLTLSDNFGVDHPLPSIDQVINPLLGSGLALAGANGAAAGNLTDPDCEDGLLTALEIMAVDLQNTTLAVLSACETGLGALTIGDGIYGLRRAFELAGVRTVIMSLWKVPDQETSELMFWYFTELTDGQGKLESLRRARGKMRKILKTRHGVDHPFYWAAFIGAGED